MAPPATRHQVRQRVLAGEEDALEVVVDLRVPHVLAHLDRPAPGRATDVVHQHVQAAEALDAARHHRRHRPGAGDIAGDAFEHAARCADALRRLVHAPRLAVGAHHLRALLREAAGHGPAVAPARADRTGAGDEHHLAGEAALGDERGGIGHGAKR
jgi:hypothetical protein